MFPCKGKWVPTILVWCNISLRTVLHLYFRFPSVLSSCWRLKIELSFLIGLYVVEDSTWKNWEVGKWALKLEKTELESSSRSWKGQQKLESDKLSWKNLNEIEKVHWSWKNLIEVTKFCEDITNWKGLLKLEMKFAVDLSKWYFSIPRNISLFLSNFNQAFQLQ